MNRLTIRALIAVAAVGLSYSVLLGLQTVSVPTELRPLTRQISDLPRELGPWKNGQDTEVDPREARLIESLGGDQFLSRTYRTDRGRVVSVHVASYAVTSPGLPNRPLDCYPNAGWTLLRDRTISLAEADGTPFPVRVLDVARNDVPARVSYWYRWGEHTVTDRGQTRFVLASFRGQDILPATIKVMIHETSPPSDPDDPQIRELAQQLFEFANSL